MNDESDQSGINDLIVNGSKSLKLQYIVSQLMWEQHFSKKDIILIFTDLFHEDEIKENFCDILRSGLRYCFKSEIPFTTAGIYINNIKKVCPDLTVELSKTITNMFKNMVMDMGNTGVSIPNKNAYLRIQQECVQALGIIPPRSSKVLRAIIYDKKCKRKIYKSPEYFIRIVDIFSEVNHEHVFSIYKSLIDQYQKEIEYHRSLLESPIDVELERRIFQRIEEIERRKSIVFRQL